MAHIDRVEFDASRIFRLNAIADSMNGSIIIALCGLSLVFHLLTPVAFAETLRFTYVVAQDNAPLHYIVNGKPTSVVYLSKGTYIRAEKVEGEQVFTTYYGKPAYIRSTFLTKPETVLIVSRDRAELFYLRDGSSYALDHLPKGTRITVEAGLGDWVFTKYNGKSARMNSEFLTTEKAFYEAEGLVQYKGEWLTPMEKYHREQVEKGLVEYRFQWVTPEAKANLEKGLVQYDGEWLTTAEKFRREQIAKGLVDYKGEWVTPDVRSNLQQGKILFRNRWVSQKEKSDIVQAEYNARLRAEQEKFAAAQRAKGLELYQGNWVSQEWLQNKIREDESSKFRIAVVLLLVVAIAIGLAVWAFHSANKPRSKKRTNPIATTSSVPTPNPAPQPAGNSPQNSGWPWLVPVLIWLVFASMNHHWPFNEQSPPKGETPTSSQPQTQSAQVARSLKQEERQKEAVQRQQEEQREPADFQTLYQKGQLHGSQIFMHVNRMSEDEVLVILGRPSERRGTWNSEWFAWQYGYYGSLDDTKGDQWSYPYRAYDDVTGKAEYFYLWFYQGKARSYKVGAGGDWKW